MNNTTLIRIKKEYHRALKIYTARHYKTMSEVVNMLINDFLEMYSHRDKTNESSPDKKLYVKPRPKMISIQNGKIVEIEDAYKY